MAYVASKRKFACEGCRFQWWIEREDVGVVAQCEKCGGVAYCTRFPPDEFNRRLDTMIARLIEEDGPYNERR